MNQGESGYFGRRGPGGNQPAGREREEQTGRPAQGHPGPPPLDVYYSNCMLVANSQRELSVLFGRYATPPPHLRDAKPLPIFAKQIFMTVEQAEELIEILRGAVEAFKTGQKRG